MLGYPDNSHQETRKINFSETLCTSQPLDILLRPSAFSYVIETYIPSYSHTDAYGNRKLVDEQIVDRKEKHFTLTDLFGRSIAIKINQAVHTVWYGTISQATLAVEFLCSTFEVPITHTHAQELAERFRKRHIGYSSKYPSGEVPIDLVNILVELRRVREGLSIWWSDREPKNCLSNYDRNSRPIGKWSPRKSK